MNKLNELSALSFMREAYLYELRRCVLDNNLVGGLTWSRKVNEVEEQMLKLSYGIAKDKYEKYKSQIEEG